MTAVPWRERDEDARKVLLAVALSILVHACLIAVVAGLLTLNPPTVVPEEEPETIQITLETPPPPDQMSYLETTASQETAEPPKDPAFQSDKNTQAAAPLPASGNLPLPSQDGEEQPGVHFENQEYTPGSRPGAAQPAQAAAPPQAPAPAAPSEPAKPAPTPQPTELALLEPPKPVTRATPPPQPEPARQDTVPTPAPQAQEKPDQKAANAEIPGFQPQTRVTRIRGNISNRGRASAAAAATPLGRYKKMLSDAIGSRWYYYVNSQIDLLNPGTLELRFIVRKSGKVEKVQVVRNSSNESFAACSVRAIMEAEIPPIPAEILPMLENERIEIEYSFTILAN